MTSNKGTEWETKGSLKIADMYKLYKSTAENPVTLKKYKEIAIACNIEFIRMVIEEGREVRMPYLSTLSIRKSKRYRKPVFDFAHFNKTGEQKFILNEHSDGYKAKFYWSKSRIPLKGKCVYSFRATRDNCRALVPELKKFNGHTKYVEYGK
jgi:hypothetical protein